MALSRPLLMGYMRTRQQPNDMARIFRQHALEFELCLKLDGRLVFRFG